MLLDDGQGLIRFSLVVAEAEHGVVAVYDFPIIICLLNLDLCRVEPEAVFTAKFPGRRRSITEHIGERWVWPTDKTGLVHPVMLDDGQGLVCFGFVPAKTEHPMAAVYNFPVARDVLNRGRGGVEG